MGPSPDVERRFLFYAGGVWSDLIARARASIRARLIRHRGGSSMPRYVVERTFPEGLEIPVTEEGGAICLNVVNNNAEDGVTWVHSYVSDDKKKTFCVYDGPNPEAIRKVAARNSLPVDRITRVSVLDPYFYR
jgi:hypothetical protein